MATRGKRRKPIITYTPKAKTCINDGCKKEFLPSNNKQVYCSKDCYYILKKERDALQMKTKRAKKRGRKKVRICKYEPCKKQFNPTIGKQVFCSKECWGKNRYYKSEIKLDTSVFPSISQKPLVPQPKLPPIQTTTKVKRTRRRVSKTKENILFSKTNFFILIFVLLITLILNFDKFVIFLNKFVAWD